MANNLDAIMTKMLLRTASRLRPRVVMPRLVNADISAETAEKGEVIPIQLPANSSTEEVVPNNVSPVPVNKTPRVVNLELNRWRKNEPFFLTDTDLNRIDTRKDFMPIQMEAAADAIISEVNGFAFSLYKRVPNFVGTAGVTPFGAGVGVKSATQAKMKLDQNKAPKANRYGVLDFVAEAAALELDAFADASKVMSNSVVMEGEIGKKYNIGWVADDDVPMHIAGTASAPAVNVGLNGAFAAGVEYINVDGLGGGTLTGKTIKVGDVFSVTDVEGVERQYAVVGSAASPMYSAITEEYTGDGDAITGLQIYPPLLSNVADNAVIDIQPSHRVNMAFHKEAFALAFRAVSTVDMSGRRIMKSFTDPLTGITLRLELLDQYKQSAWEYDILYGGKDVRPELACRILG